jgi:hypothetical protein
VIYAPAVGKYKKCIFKICASKLKKKIQKLQMELKKNCDFRLFPQMTFNPNIAKTAP